MDGAGAGAAAVVFGIQQKPTPTPLAPAQRPLVATVLAAHQADFAVHVPNIKDHKKAKKRNEIT